MRIFLILFLVSFSIYAQDSYSISGMLRNQLGNTPVSGAIIIIEGAEEFTIYVLTNRIYTEDTAACTELNVCPLRDKVRKRKA